MSSKEERRARARAQQKAAEARRRREELRRRRRGRIIGFVATLGVLAILAVFAAGVFGGEEDEGNGGDGQTASAEDGVCDFDVDPPEHNGKQFDQPASPEQVLGVGVDYWAVVETSCGTVEIDLLEKRAPNTVANFIFLSEEDFYDGLTFHRIAENFVIQGGDPKGDGSGGPGYQFDDELPNRSKVYTAGAVAMANSGPDTQGSQFFIVSHEIDVALEGEKPDPAGLQALYSYFGRATEDSFETIDAIQSVETGTGEGEQESPVQPVYILDVTIEER